MNIIKNQVIKKGTEGLEGAESNRSSNWRNIFNS